MADDGTIIKPTLVGVGDGFNYSLNEKSVTSVTSVESYEISNGMSTKSAADGGMIRVDKQQRARSAGTATGQGGRKGGPAGSRSGQRKSTTSKQQRLDDSDDDAMSGDDNEKETNRQMESTF